MKDKPMLEGMLYNPNADPVNRGITGQDLNDFVNKPEGDTSTGTPGAGADVNMNPWCRADEGH